MRCQLEETNGRSNDRSYRLEDQLRRLMMDKHRLSAQEQDLEQQISELEF